MGDIVNFCTDNDNGGCGGLLRETIDIHTNTIIYKCNHCDKPYELTGRNTRILSVEEKIPQIMLTHINKIPFIASPKIAKECPKCKAPYVSYAVLEDETTIVYTCYCRHVFN